MKILSLSLDPQILNKESVVASRVIRYGNSVDLYTVIVPRPKKMVIELSFKVSAHGSGGGLKVIQFFKLLFIAMELATQNKYDVITSQDTYFLGIIGFFLARRFHTGLEVQVLGIEKLNFFRKFLSIFVLKRASAIRVLSVGLKRRLIDELHISEQKMSIVPIYVDVSSLGFDQSDRVMEVQMHNEAFQKEYGDRFNIVSVNRLVPIKNIAMQLEAVAQLTTSLPNVLLHIVGDGPLKNELEQHIQRLQLQKHVILHGYRSGAALSPFFTQTDCFVLTSDFEGYGMVVIEAATAGLPIVMTNVGCAGEIIIDGESGLVVPPRDLSAFVQAIRRILEDALLREKLAQGALRSIAKLPSFDTVLEQYKKSWQKALANKL